MFDLNFEVLRVIARQIRFMELLLEFMIPILFGCLHFGDLDSNSFGGFG
jgi:hypothetical protein